MFGHTFSSHFLVKALLSGCLMSFSRIRFASFSKDHLRCIFLFRNVGGAPNVTRRVRTDCPGSLGTTHGVLFGAMQPYLLLGRDAWMPCFRMFKATEVSSKPLGGN